MTQLLQQLLAQPVAAAVSVQPFCQAVRLPRSTFYRLAHQPIEADEEEMAVRDRIQPLALEMPFYGYRRITAHLHRQGLTVNHKRVLRLMRQDNLLCLRKRKNFLVTTDSNHQLAIYPNLAANLAVTGINQLSVAEIVRTQMTKTDTVTSRASRNRITDFHLPIGNYNPVD